MDNLITFAIIGTVYIVSSIIKYFKSDDEKKKKRILIGIIIVSIAFSANYIDFGSVLLSKMNIIELPTYSGYMMGYTQGKILGAEIYVKISDEKFGMNELNAVTLSLKMNEKYVVAYTPITKTVVSIKKADSGL